MMVRNKRVQMILIMIVFIGAIVFAQDNQPDATQQLREEILSVHKAQGEQGLREFYQKNQDRITHKFICDFAEAGIDKRKEKWLKICEILAELRGDQKTIAGVALKFGEYYRLIPHSEKAMNHLKKALTLYIKLDDSAGQGNTYLGMGKIYDVDLKYKKSQEMLAKALSLFKKANDQVGQGMVYKQKGDVFLNAADYENAGKMYDKALTIFKKENYLSGQANAYRGKADILFRTDQKNKAIVMYDTALAIYKKDKNRLGQGNIYFRKAYMYIFRADYVEASQLLDKAMAKYKEVNHNTGIGNIYMRKGEIHRLKGKYPKAIEMFEKSLQYFEKAENMTGQGKIYISLGMIWYYTSQNEKAIEMCNKALAIAEKSGMPIDIGNVYFVKARIYIRTGNITKAETMIDKALRLYQKAQDNIGLGNIYLAKGEIHIFKGETAKASAMYARALACTLKTGIKIGLGHILLSQGDKFLYQGNTLKAREMYEKATGPIKKSDDPHIQGVLYLRRGNTYLRSGNFSKARNMCYKSLPFFEKVNDLQNQGNAYIEIGESYYYNHEDEMALKMYNKALPFCTEAGDVRGQASVYMRFGDIHLKKRNYDKALEMYNKALPTFERAGAHINQSNLLRNKGEIFFRTGKHKKALAEYKKSLSLATAFGDLVSEAFTLFKMAELFEKQGNNENVLSIIENGIANLEKLRSQIAISEFKRTLQEKHYQPYEESVIFLLKNNYYDKAFHYAEYSKSRVFLDQIAEGLVNLDKGMKPGQKTERENLLGTLSRIKKELYLLGSNKDDAKLRQLKNDNQKVERKLEELLVKIRLENPLYADVRYPQPVTVQALRKEVLKKSEILLHYFIFPEKACVFLVSRDKFEVVPLDTGEKEINSDAGQFLLALDQDNDNHIKRYGKSLYEKLTKPLEKKLTGYDDIIIVPDGRLETIPFESFVIDTKDDRPVFLLEKYRLKYIQSASVLSQLRKHYKRDRETNSFIGFADPVYTPEEPEKKKAIQSPASAAPPGIEEEIKEVHQNRYKRSGGNQNRLIKSGEEVKTIARLFQEKSQKATVYTRKQATEEKAKALDMKDCDFIHFACHGLANDDFQCLILSQDIPGSKEDGYFTLNEIMNCKYHAKLIVLSACQTGSGKLDRAEGVTGLTRGMMYAGTSAVVASLWEVDSPATKELMIAFYRNMLEKGMDKAEALRQAKMELLKKKEYASPTYWSAFVLYGE